MEHVHVCIIDPTFEYAKKIAKLTSESDYKIYNFKQDEKVICIYEPHRYPDKIQSLTCALYSSDFCVWVIDKIDPVFAQTALALWLKNTNGIMVFTQNIVPEQVEPMLKNSPMWQWEKLQSAQDNDIRQKLLSLKPSTNDSSNVALVDSCFAVGGVGTVALTKILSGKFKVHDELTVIPFNTKTAIRSIQEQDVDVKETSIASRAGFSLKNIQPEKVKRGSYLTNSTQIKQFQKGKVKFSIHPLIKDEISNKSELFFAWDLQYVSAKLQMDKITSQDGEKEFDFELVSICAAKEGQKVLIVRNSKSPKVIASGEISALQ
jgi:selenocysteine-specific translation elongation factor